MALLHFFLYLFVPGLDRLRPLLPLEFEDASSSSWPDGRFCPRSPVKIISLLRPFKLNSSSSSSKSSNSKSSSSSSSSKPVYGMTRKDEAVDPLEFRLEVVNVAASIESSHIEFIYDKACILFFFCFIEAYYIGAYHFEGEPCSGSFIRQDISEMLEMMFSWRET